MHLVGQGFILQQDNDPKFKSKLCQNYLRKNEQVVQAKQPTSATHLWEPLQQSWAVLPEEHLISIVERMPQVCSAVKSVKGGYIDKSKV